MSERNATILYAAVVGVRATAFMFSVFLLESMGPFTLMAERFLLAFAVLLFVFRKKLAHLNKRVVAHGAVLGLLFFIVMTLELHALMLAPSSTVSFLENTAIVFVPVLAAVLARKLPDAKTVACTTIVMAGVALITLSAGMGFGIGEAMALSAALAYTLAIVATDRFSREDDAALVGMLEVGFVGVFALVAAFTLEQPVLPVDPAAWCYLIIVAVACTGFGFAFQPVAQRRISAEAAGLLCGISPLTATALGVAVLAEQLSLQSLVGMALILAGILARKAKVDVRFFGRGVRARS